jgi:nicotinamide-nucleotide amidase
MAPSAAPRLAKRVIRAAAKRRMRITAAESCTGGLVAAALTEIPGASDCFVGGFVTYSNALKAAALGVPKATLRRFGAVSAETARAMARGALRKAKADVAVAVTGIAGPAGGSKRKPVGLVHFATARREGTRLTATEIERRFPRRGRHAIRRAATAFALSLLLNEILRA